MRLHTDTHLRWLAARIRPSIGLHAAGHTCIIAASLLALLDPLMMKWLIDDVLARRRTWWVPVVACAFVGNYLARRLLDYAGVMLGTRAVHRLMFSIRRELLRRVYRFSASCLEARAVGDTQHRIEQDVTQTGTLGAEIIPNVVRLVTMAIAVLTAMLLLNPVLAMLVLPLAPAFVFLRAKYRDELQNRGDIAQARSAAVAAFLQEHLAGAIQIQLLGREAGTCRRFARLSAAAIRAEVSRRRSELIFGSLLYLVVVCGMAGVLGVGGQQVLAGTLTTGGLVAFYGYTLQLFLPLYGLVDVYAKLQRVSASVRRVRELLEEGDTVPEHPAAIDLPGTGAASVELRGVMFGYEDGTRVIDGIDLHIAPGEKVALTGASGCGKSTIARLIARLNEADRGAIMVDGIDVRRLTLSSLRSAIVYVPQEPFLFDVSLEENLRYANRHASAEELRQAASAAQLEPLLERDGWDQPLGARGCRLSGGERQRVALARALLGHPRLLILDESTSALDAITERRVLDALHTVLTGTTVVCISHRAAALHWADRVLTLRGGHLVALDAISARRRDAVLLHQPVQTGA
jgi:subfamily B ATP-binding cassette protein MsbA